MTEEQCCRSFISWTPVLLLAGLIVYSYYAYAVQLCICKWLISGCSLQLSGACTYQMTEGGNSKPKENYDTLSTNRQHSEINYCLEDNKEDY